MEEDKEEEEDGEEEEIGSWGFVDEPKAKRSPFKQTANVKAAGTLTSRTISDDILVSIVCFRF